MAAEVHVGTPTAGSARVTAGAAGAGDGTYPAARRGPRRALSKIDLRIKGEHFCVNRTRGSDGML